MKTFAFLLPIALLAAAAGPAPGQTPAGAAPAAGHAGGERPVIRAGLAASAVRVDGRLDEPAWSAATPATRFVQDVPDEGQPASEATEARVLYDAEALYVGVRLHDRERVSARLGRRDMPPGDSDWIGVLIDSYHDHRTAYLFDVNPAGVRRDAFRTEQGDDMSWDAVWEAAVTRDAGGWTAEYRIPFSQLRFSPADSSTWGIQIGRVVARRRESATFAFTPSRERGGVAAYGHLTGLRGLRPGRRLELLPYSVARADYGDPGTNPFRSRREHGLDLGGDLRYRVTSDLTLDATFNPDFGQVEQDPAEVNLTAFETFFPERRPFFVAGADRFSFGAGAVGPGAPSAGLFYTRRIGRSPQLRSPVAAADVPSATTILGAAKLSGRTREGWSIGLLGAVTEREEARFLDPGGREELAPVEPATGYLVGRVGRELRAGRTSLGAIVTAVSRDLDDGRLRGALPSGAFAGGAEVRHEFARQAWRASGFLVGSHLRGSEAAILAVQRSPLRYYQRPDAGHLDVDAGAASLGGWAGQLQLAKQAGLHWTGDVGVHATSPGYEVNDLGFLTRADQVGANFRNTYTENRPGRVLRRYTLTQATNSSFNFDGDHVANTFFLGSTWQTLGYWGLEANVGYSMERMDDRLTRGGPLALRPADWRVFTVLTSDSRRAVSGRMEVYYGEDDAGGGQWWASPDVTIRPSSRWSLVVGPRLEKRRVAAQYVAQVPAAGEGALSGTRYLFAPLRQTTLSLETRLGLTFTPDLSFEAYAEPFFSAGDFGGLKQLRAPRTFDFDPAPAGSLPEGDRRGRDFNLRSLRGNAVLRWEWRPGSTLYLAWQQTRADDAPLGDLRFGRDGRALFRSDASDVLVLKVSYWLNL